MSTPLSNIYMYSSNVLFYTFVHIVHVNKLQHLVIYYTITRKSVLWRGDFEIIFDPN